MERLSIVRFFFVLLSVMCLVLVIFTCTAGRESGTAVTVVTPSIERNCSKLFAGDKEEILRVKLQLNHWKNLVSDEELLEKTENCSWVENYLTGNFYTTQLELSFPIAFTYVVYNSPQQILRLLRVHYRQHNVYCIHPDKKSSRTFSGIFHNIAACLDNIIIPTTLVDVVWGTESIMEAQMTCLRELMQYSERQGEGEKWKYVINLCGKELPLTTTHGIIEHLTKLNDSSSIKTSKLNKENRLDRLGHKPIPFGLPGYKSMTYMTLSYKFTHFLLTNPTAVQLYNFFRGCRQPEEHYYATVYMIPGVPGGYDPKLSKTYFATNNCFWKRDIQSCGGKIVHNICIVSVTELKEILEKSKDGKWSLFHNKYFMEVDHVVMDCMEERLMARNKMEFKHDYM